MPSANTILLLAGLVAHATAATIPVSVGRNGLTFDPAEIRAQMGDVIEFRFYPRNHSVVAGDFERACQPVAHDGFFSGFFPTEPNTINDQVFRVTVTHTNPVPIYCSQNTGAHCKNGMVAVINPEQDGGRQTLEAYKRLAADVPDAVSPSGGAFGGIVAQMDGPDDGSPTTTAPAPTSPTASPTTSTTNGAEAVIAPVAGLLAAAAAVVFV